MKKVSFKNKLNKWHRKLRRIDFRAIINRVSRKWQIFTCVSLVLAIGALIFGGLVSSTGRTLRSQRAAETWAGNGETKFAQVSVFLSEDSAIDMQKIYSFRDEITKNTADLMPEGVKNPYTDAWSTTGSATVKGEHGTADASVIAVGGNYFFFHPQELLSGTYFSDEDVMNDRVVLDEELAWRLFGSSSLEGMSVTVNGKNFVVAGVISREDDFASKSAYTAGAGLYMSYDAYSALIDGQSEDAKSAAKVKIDCYEVVMPEPVTSFAAGLVGTSFNPDGKNVVVENTYRYTGDNLLDIMKNFGERTIRSGDVSFPYWENAARLVENRCVIFLLIELILWICPIVFAVVLLVKLYKYARNKIKAKYVDLKDKYDNRVLFRGMKGAHEKWQK